MLSHGRLVVGAVWRARYDLTAIAHIVILHLPPRSCSPDCPGHDHARCPWSLLALAPAIEALLPCSTPPRRTPLDGVKIRLALPVQGDMIFTLGSNPVAEAIRKAAEP